MEGPHVRAAHAIVVLALCCAAAPAQHPSRPPKWRIDPYTKNDPEVMARLGYVSYGPFEFGQRGDKAVTTADIDTHMHYARILWVETPHLRIGSALEPWSVPFDPVIKAKIRAELTELKERGKLRRLNVKTRTLDSWLRL